MTQPLTALADQTRLMMASSTQGQNAPTWQQYNGYGAQTGGLWGGVGSTLGSLFGRTDQQGNVPGNYPLPGGNYGFQTPSDVSIPSFGGPYSQSGTTPSFGLMAGANNALLQGGPAGGLLDELRGGASTNIAQMFSGPQVANFSGIPAANDPTAAISGMLSGQGRYDLVQNAVRAGAQPTLDILSEDIMPALRSRTVGSGGNATGEIKDLNRIVPRVMRDITNAGTQAALGEYNRAMGARDQAAGLMSGLGMDARKFGAGLEQNAMDTYRNQVLGLGNLVGGLTGQQSQDMRAGLLTMPQTIQAGLMPMQMMQQYGGYERDLREQALQDSLNRWNLYQNRPMEMSNWFNQILSGVPGLGGTQTSQMPEGSPAAGALSGGIAGMGLHSLLTSGASPILASNPGLWPFLLGGAALGGLL